MSQENVDAVRAVYEEWGKGNFRAGVDLYDRHVLFVPTDDWPEAGRYLGTEGIEEYMQEFLSAWTSVTIAGDEFIEAENSVVVAVRQSAMGQESGFPTEQRYFHVWTFRGRTVTRLDVIWDRAEALEAVGLSE